jgi:hypothetical protein
VPSPTIARHHTLAAPIVLFSRALRLGSTLPPLSDLFGDRTHARRSGEHRRRWAAVVALVLLVCVTWRAWPLPTVLGEGWVGAHHAQDSVVHALSLDVLARHGLDDEATPWLKPHLMVRGLTDQMPAYAPAAALLSRVAGGPLGGYHLLTLLVLLLNGLVAYLLFARLTRRGPALLGAALLVMQPWMGLHLPRVQLLSLWPLMLGLVVLVSPRRSPWRVGLGLTAATALAWGTGLILSSVAVPGLLVATFVVAQARKDVVWGAAGVGGVVAGSALMWPLLEVHARVRDAYALPDLGPVRDAWAEGTLPLWVRSEQLTVLWSSADVAPMERALFPGLVVLAVGGAAMALRVLGRFDVLLSADSLLVKPMALVRGVALLAVLGVGLLQRDLGPFGWGLLLVTLIGSLITPPTTRRALAGDLFALLALAGLVLGLGSLVVIGEHAYRTPLYWLAQAGPPFESLRTPHRLLVFAHLGFLGLMVVGVDLLTAKTRAAGRALGLVAAVALLDVMPTPAAVVHPRVAAEVAPSLRALTAAADDGLLLHIPFRAQAPGDDGLEVVEAERMLWQQTHGRPMLNGFAGFLPPIAETLLHDHLERSAHPEQALRALGVRYVHLAFFRMTETARQRWGRWVVNTPGLEVLDESEHDLLLALAPGPERGSTRLAARYPSLPQGCWLAETDGFQSEGRSDLGGLLREAPSGTGASVELRCPGPVAWDTMALASDHFEHLPRALVIERWSPTGWAKVGEVAEVLPWGDIARPGALPVVAMEIGAVAERVRLVDASPAGGHWHLVAVGGSARSVP